MSRIFMPEYRPCIAKRKKALFHCWTSESTALLGDSVKITYGIVEREDGRVEIVDALRIRFVDKKMLEYNFPDKK